MLPGTVVVAHQRAHPLHDAVGRQVKEGLEFVVDAQHRHIALGVDRQQAVQEGDQQAGQGQIQDGRYTDGIELAVKGGIEPQAAAGEADGDFGGAVDIEVDYKGNGLPDAGGKGRTGNAQGGHRPKAEDEDRVEGDVGHAAGDQRHHGNIHPAHGLEDLLKGEVCHVDQREQEHDGGVGHAHVHQSGIGSEAAQEAGHDGNAEDHAQYAVQQGKHHAVGGGSVGVFVVACAEVERDLGIDADAEADGHCIDKVLDGKHQRKRRHGLLADLGHKEAVHDVVQAVYQHRDDVGQGHGEQQREHRSGFHKSIVHFHCS